MKNQRPQSMANLELRISYFLRYGVFLSAFFLGLGWLLRLTTSNETLDHFQVYDPQPLQDMIEKSFISQDYSMLSATLGLAILIYLPTIRVFLTAYLFLRNRDWYLAAMAIFVFAVLILSVLLGIDL